MNGFTAGDVPSQQGKCVVVTGANTGIGLATAHVLAERGARVLLACRDRDKAQDAMSRIRKAVPGADLAFVPLDQADLGSVRDAAEIIGWEPRVDVLVNNAGASCSRRCSERCRVMSCSSGSITWAPLR